MPSPTGPVFFELTGEMLRIATLQRHLSFFRQFWLQATCADIEQRQEWRRSQGNSRSSFPQSWGRNASEREAGISWFPGPTCVAQGPRSLRASSAMAPQPTPGVFLWCTFCPRGGRDCGLVKAGRRKRTSRPLAPRICGGLSLTRSFYPHV